MWMRMRDKIEDACTLNLPPQWLLANDKNTPQDPDVIDDTSPTKVL